MKKNALRKDFFMEIRKSLGRFLSIFLIVALGVSLFVGIRATQPDMLLSGDTYADKSKLMDIKVVSTFGLTEEDLQEIENLSAIENVEGAYSADVLCNIGDSVEVLHVMSQTEDMNLITVTEGRLPENSKECLLDDSLMKSSSYKIGDKIRFESGTDDDLTDTLSAAEYEIVGSGTSAMYFSYDRGSSLIGKGTVSGFAIVSPENFELDVFTEVYATVSGAYETVAYTEEYEALVDEAIEQIEAIQDLRCEARRDEIVEEVQVEIDDARQELDEKRTEAEEEIQDGEEEIRDSEIEIEDAKLEIADGKEQIADGKEQIADGKEQIADGKEQIADGKAQIESGKAEIEDGKKQIADGKKQIADGKAEIEAGKKQIADGKTQIEKGRDELTAGRKEFEANKKALTEQKAAVEAGLKELYGQKEQLEMALAVQQENAQFAQGEQLMIIQATIAELEMNLGIIDGKITELNSILETQIKPGEFQLAEAEQELITNEQVIEAQEQVILENEKELLANEAELLKQEAELAKQEAELIKGEKELIAQEKELKKNGEELYEQEEELIKNEKELYEQEEELLSAEQELLDGEKELEEGKQELEDAKQELAEKIQEGEEEIQDAEKEIADLEYPEWYVFDRETIPEYSGYGDNAERIAALSIVFPSLFFFVAALISLTTMTRMVEEQRVQIGTLKALGYSEFAIMKKYLYYALAATLGGSALGVLIGEKVFPYVIIAAYHMTVYPNITEILIPYRWGIGVAATVIAVLCTGMAAISSCHRELRSQPAILMRPEAPKVGKKTFLEKIPFLWKHLNFSWKSSLRNLFRYKKRFFMTLFGIGGCMGLLMVGYGLRDSISSIAQFQFGELQLYNSSVYVDENIEDSERNELYEYLAKHEDVTNYMAVNMESITTENEDEQMDAYLMVIDDQEQANDFFVFRDRKTKARYDLGDDGIIISEKTASMLGAEEGDEILLTEEGKYGKTVRISNICENYFGHYVYMTGNLYREVYGKDVDHNNILIKAREGLATENLEKIGEHILTFDDILNVQYTSNMEQSLNDMLVALDRVMVVLIIVAGLLSFVVLYNLNNINITERRRELATLKVLGFFSTEVGLYVYRENIILTLLGIMAGCGMGKFLHLFTIKTVEVDQAMFGRVISLESYLICAAFTLAFSIIVNWIMYFKLKRINMVESLKSVE